MADSDDFMQWLKDHQGIISLLLIIVCAVLLPINILSMDVYKELQDYRTEAILDYEEEVDNWDMWIFMGSFMGLMMGLLYFYTFQTNHSKFVRLIDTGSKQTFIKNQEDIELLAWKLGTRYEQIVRMKKKELGIEKKKKKKIRR